MQTIRETAVAKRAKVLSLIRAAERAEVDDARVKSEVDTITAMAQAKAKATIERADAERDRMLAEAKGNAAMIEAQNQLSPEVIALKIEEERLRTLPQVVERMMNAG